MTVKGERKKVRYFLIFFFPLNRRLQIDTHYAVIYLASTAHSFIWAELHPNVAKKTSQTCSDLSLAGVNLIRVRWVRADRNVHAARCVIMIRRQTILAPIKICKICSPCKARPSVVSLDEESRWTVEGACVRARACVCVSEKTL